MKKLLIIPAFLLAFSPVFGNSVIEGQAKHVFLRMVQIKPG
jgi:hypothetical protein